MLAGIRLLIASASVSLYVTVILINSFMSVFYINANCYYSNYINTLDFSRDFGCVEVQGFIYFKLGYRNSQFSVHFMLSFKQTTV